MDTKICDDCLTARTVDQFYPAPGKADHLASRCIRCSILASRTPIGDFASPDGRARINREWAEARVERDERVARRKFKADTGIDIPKREPAPLDTRVHLGGKR